MSRPLSGQLHRDATAAKQGAYPGDIQMYALQEQHGEEQPRLVSGQPLSYPVPGPHLVRGERDRRASDVRVTADLVGVGVVTVVLGGPPAVAKADQQVAVDAADQVVSALGAGDLAMAGVVPDEPGLGEHDPEEYCHQHLPPGSAEQEEHGPAAEQQKKVDTDLNAVVNGAPVQQPGSANLAG
jgi:hypothetical protein